MLKLWKKKEKIGGISSKYLSLELIFMFLKFNKINDKLVVTLVGELDHHSAEEVRVKIDDRIEKRLLWILKKLPLWIVQELVLL